MQRGAAWDSLCKGKANERIPRLGRILRRASAGDLLAGASHLRVPPHRHRLLRPDGGRRRLRFRPDAETRLTLPILAIEKGSGQDQVWVIDDNGKLARRSVTTGRRDEAQGLIEVVAGIAPTTQVLSTRFDNLREGRKAVVVPRAQPVASAGQAASAAAR